MNSGRFPHSCFLTNITIMAEGWNGIGHYIRAPVCWPECRCTGIRGTFRDKCFLHQNLLIVDGALKGGELSAGTARLSAHDLTSCQYLFLAIYVVDCNSVVGLSNTNPEIEFIRGWGWSSSTEVSRSTKLPRKRGSCQRVPSSLHCTNAGLRETNLQQPIDWHSWRKDHKYGRIIDTCARIRRLYTSVSKVCVWLKGPEIWEERSEIFVRLGGKFALVSVGLRTWTSSWLGWPISLMGNRDIAGAGDIWNEFESNEIRSNDTNLLNTLRNTSI